MSFDHYAYTKNRRDEARSRGDCQSCCRQPALRNPNGTLRSRCKDCDRRATETHQRRKEKAPNLRAMKPTKAQIEDWCGECQAFGFHREGCITWTQRKTA